MGRTSDARERLLDAATELIHDRGYTAVGVSELCSAAGVKKGSFYHFFASKQQLVEEVVDGFGRHYQELIEQALAPPGTPLERLERYLRRALEAQMASCGADGTDRGCLLGNLALEMSTQEPVIRERLAAIFAGMADAMAPTIAEAAEAGELAGGVDARARAGALVAFLEGATLLNKVHGRREIDDVIGHSLRLLGARRNG